MSARPILTVAEMAEADRAAIAAGTPAIELMRRAGLAVADAICDRFDPRPTAVLCGPGDNGGDGYVVAALLAERGWPVWVERMGPPKSDSARQAAEAWAGETLDLGQGDRAADLIVDALFGAGLVRPLSGEAARIARTSERRSEQVVAIDLPSGVAGDTGQALGDAAFWAGLTVTFHSKKPGHVLEPGQGRCGEVVVADIGLAPVDTGLIENAPDAWLARFPWPSATSTATRKLTSSSPTRLTPSSSFTSRRSVSASEPARVSRGWSAVEPCGSRTWMATARPR